MSIPQELKTLSGHWAGPSHLYLSWPPTDETSHHSPSTALITPVANGKFLSLQYTWVYKGVSQEGQFILGLDGRGNVRASWIDSWHMSDTMMICEGKAESGKVVMTGSYAAPPGPDWHWRTEIHAGNDGSFKMLMYNISPEGEETPAVEAEYTRVKIS